MTLGAGKICGMVWNSSPTAAVQAAAGSIATSCTWSTPFKWGVRFNAEEIAIKTPVAAIVQNTNENYVGTAGTGTGTTGFYMAFWQNTC